MGTDRPTEEFPLGLRTGDVLQRRFHWLSVLLVGAAQPGNLVLHPFEDDTVVLVVAEAIGHRELRKKKKESYENGKIEK